jgi:hypothetical protein
MSGTRELDGSMRVSDEHIAGSSARLYDQEAAEPHKRHFLSVRELNGLRVIILSLQMIS